MFRYPILLLTIAISELPETCSPPAPVQPTHNAAGTDPQAVGKAGVFRIKKQRAGLPPGAPAVLCSHFGARMANSLAVF